jgi:FkbM family methyltransferase
VTILRALYGNYCAGGGWRTLSSRRFLSGLFKTPYAYLGRQEAVVQCYSGHSIFVNTQDTGVGASIVVNGLWESYVERLFRREIKVGQTVVDVGANVGYHTLVMASLVGPSGHVFAIEPQRKACDLLQRSLHLNAFQNRVSLLNIGLGSAESVEKIVIPLTWTSGAHIEPRASNSSDNENRGHESYDVTVRRLDDVISGQHVDFIKIDTEGYEFEVIQGFGALLNLPNLKILMEWSLPQLALRSKNPAELLTFLRQRGFTIAELLKDGSCANRSDAEILEIEHTDLFVSRQTPR